MSYLNDIANNRSRKDYQYYQTFLIFLLALGMIGAVFFGVRVQDGTSVSFLDQNRNYWELLVLVADLLMLIWALWSFPVAAHTADDNKENLKWYNFVVSTVLIFAVGFAVGKYVFPLLITPKLGITLGVLPLSSGVAYFTYQKRRSFTTMAMITSLGIAHVVHLVGVFPKFSTLLLG